MIIGIDGPAGSGKTTVAKLLAARLGIQYLDTGATYRTLTYAALQGELDLSDSEALAKIAKELKLEFRENKVYLDGQDISSQIRTPLIDKNISVVVSHPQVREVMVGLQRALAKENDFVVEGRDITTVVFPKAKYKFYLDGDPKIRAKRRHKELQDKGANIDLCEVEKDLIRRDHADKNREVGALKISQDARHIDTTGLSIEEVIEELPLKVSHYLL